MESASELTGHQRCIDEWINSLTGEKSGIVTDGTDSRKTVEVAEAAYLSEETGRIVRLPLREELL